jgi:hypothetical protein
MQFELTPKALNYETIPRQVLRRHFKLLNEVQQRLNDRRTLLFDLDVHPPVLSVTLCLTSAGQLSSSFRSWDESGKKCLVFSVTMTLAFRLTGSGDANKYNVFSNLQGTDLKLKGNCVRSLSI